MAHEASQRVGPQRTQLFGASLQLVDHARQQRTHQRIAVGEVAVERGPADAGTLGHQVQRGLGAMLEKHLEGRIQQQLEIGLGI